MVDFYRAPPTQSSLTASERQAAAAAAAAAADQEDDDDGLGPLPPNWEKAFTEHGETYFIDHTTGTSHWLDPRLKSYQKKSLEDCQDDELPYGWEKIQDPQYGTYFIDHVNRRTQYENPVLEAKRRSERRRMAGATQTATKPNPFTKNPAELQGERIMTTLLKSSRGLGFTIIGGDDNIDEFLQIKSIVPNGPAWLDGKLQTGDVLVYVNETCTLGYKHHEMVNVFQSIMAGETVSLEVCRGYPLPFDPNDPNTEVVTTIAVEPTPMSDNTRLNKNGPGFNYIDAAADNVKKVGPQADAKNGTLKSDNIKKFNKDDEAGDVSQILNVTISKGPLGFGFTIADSAYGQKVKKILDPNCCKDLQEGDLLLAINNTSVMYMNHNSVVQVLKNCSKSEPAIIKIQRGQSYNGNLALELNNWRENGGVSDADSNVFRSKTPTTDTFSVKDVMPQRSKTPVFEARSRAKTPSSDLNGGNEEVDSLMRHDENRKHAMADTKSNSSFPDQDSINNEVPHMDAFPKLVSNLSDRLAETSLNHNGARSGRLNQTNVNQFEHETSNFVPNNLDFYRNIHSNGNYSNSPNSSTYAVASGEMQTKLSYLAPVPTYHHDNCYCYECNDYNRYQRETLHQQQQKPYNLPQYGQSQNFNGRYQAGMPGPQAAYSNAAKEQNGGYDLDLYEITLERRAQGFGFRIVGGTEEGSQVTVGHIVPGGSADADPRIATGDEILSIDGHNVVQASHHRVVQLMGEAAQRGYVTMILRRRSPNMNSGRPQYQPQAVQFPYEVVVHRNEHEGFGFVIISSSNQYNGSQIGQILPGSPGERCGELKVGDRIIAVNGIDISGMTHGDVVNLIKDSGLYVRLTIGDPAEDYRHGLETNGVGNYEHQRMQSQLCL